MPFKKIKVPKTSDSQLRAQTSYRKRMMADGYYLAQIWLPDTEEDRADAVKYAEKRRKRFKQKSEHK